MIAVNARPDLHISLKDFGGSLRSQLPDPAYVGLCELQLDGIDKAGLNKCASFAYAFAVVLRIDEAAIIAEIFIEAFACSGENLPKVDRGNLRNLRAYFIAHLEDFAKNENQTLAAVQTEQSSEHTVVLCLFDKKFNRDGHSAWVG